MCLIYFSVLVDQSGINLSLCLSVCLGLYVCLSDALSISLVCVVCVCVLRLTPVALSEADPSLSPSPGRGERGGAARVRRVPAGGARPSHRAGLQREAAAPPQAEARPGPGLPAAGAPRNLPAGEEPTVACRWGHRGNAVKNKCILLTR